MRIRLIFFQRATLLSLAGIFLAWMALGPQAVEAQALKAISGITTAAGSGTQGFGGDGGAAVAAAFDTPVGLATDAAGNLYIADNLNNRVRKVSAATGVISTLAGTGSAGFAGDGGAASAAELNTPDAVAVDGAGDVFIADTGNQRVRMVAAATGTISTVAGTGAAGFGGDGGAATAAELYFPISLSLDGAGDLYIADYGNNRIRKVTAGTGTISTVAGNGTAGESGDGGPATAAEIVNPNDVRVDGAGNQYIAEGCRVRKVAAASGVISTLAGGAVCGFSGDGGAATAAELNEPGGLALDGVGDVFIADSSNNRVREISVLTGVIATITGNGGAGFSGDGGAAAVGQTSADAVAVDRWGDVFIADDANNRVREISSGPRFAPAAVGSSSAARNLVIEAGDAITLAGIALPAGAVDFEAGALGGSGCALGAELAANTICTLPITFAPAAAGLLAEPVVITDSGGNRYTFGLSGTGIGAVGALAPGVIATMAGTGVPGFSGDGGAGTAAAIDDPAGIAVDRSGNVYFADQNNHRIRELGAGGGSIITVAGNGTAGTSGDGGSATAAELQEASGVALDGAGNVYFADMGANRVREISAATGVITTVAGNGASGYAGDGSLATAAQLALPWGVAVDSAGNLYIADSGNNVIRKVDASSGIVTTIAGNRTGGESGDGGMATAAELAVPMAVAVDGAGNVYIADSGNNRVREIGAATGVITTVAGSGAAGESGDGGAATAAEINDPDGLAVDAAGNLYIADGYGTVVREVNAVSGFISTVAGNGNNGYSGDGGPAPLAGISRPAGIALDAAANLYVADSLDNRIRKVSVGATVLPFANQLIATASSPQTVVLGNAGNAPLTPASAAITGDYTQTDTCGSALAPGAACALTLTFTPTGAGARAGALTLTDNGVPATQTVALSGTGVAPAAGLAPAALSFASQTVGSVSAAQTITLNNSGTGALDLASVTVTANFAETNSCGSSVAAGASCLLSVSFTPSAIGALTGTLTVADNAAGSPQTVALNGTGAAPAATFSPATVAFGAQNVGVSSAAQNVSLANSGNTALAITGIATSGDFAETNNCPASLAVNAACVIAVTFAPTAAGARTGTLSVADNGADSPQTAALSGTGTAPAAALTPATLTFAAQATGSTSAAQTLTLANSGTATLALTSITASGDYAETNTCGASVAAGASCTIAVTFTPAAAGARAGALSVADNVAASPQTAALSGVGTAPILTLTPAMLSFAAQATGSSSAAQSVTVANSGTAALVLASIAASGDYAQTNTCGASVAAGASCTIAVTFTPAATGARAGALSVADNAAGSPQSVVLNGMGADVTMSAASGSSTSSTITAGETAAYQLTLTPVDGFAGSMALTCTGAPAAAACTASPATLAVGGTAAAASVSVSTTARSMGAPPAGGGTPIERWIFTGLGLLLAGWLGVAAAAPRRRPALAGACGIFAILALSLSCGGGGGSGGNATAPPTTVSGTPAGTYTLTATATGGGTVRSQSLTLIVK